MTKQMRERGRERKVRGGMLSPATVAKLCTVQVGKKERKEKNGVGVNKVVFLGMAHVACFR